MFKILLPCSYEESTTVQINPDVVTGSGKILLVDDEELIRTTGKLMLEEMGYTVLLAENGRSAVELFKQVYREIDLVVMDMVMPEMNGGDAFEEMRSIDPACKVIISSGFSKSRSIDELKKSGLSGFIQKPFRNSQLSQMLAEVLSN